MNNPIGVSSFAFAFPMTNAALDTLEQLAALGYEHVEVCLDDPAHLDPAALRAAAARNGLTLSIGGVFTADRDVAAADAATQRHGIEYLTTCVEFAEAAGARIVSGPMYSAAGRTQVMDARDRSAQRARAANALRDVADLAAERGITLAIEPLNRFETDLINTVDQALALLEVIDRPNVGLAFDTFHAHIEEKDLADAVRAAGGRLVSFQASESDRGTPGTGQVRWDDAFAALRDIGYAGPVIVESFDWTDPDVAAALSLWRPVAASMPELVRASIDFLTPYCRTLG